VAKIVRESAESHGFSALRLKRLESALRAMVDAGALAGIATLLTRRGKLAHATNYGDQDLATKTPIRDDTIYRIYSMTKPVTAVAMMILYEEGRWLPNDPLAKYISEFAGIKVCCGVDGAGNMQTEEASHPPTVGELMTQTAGIGRGEFGTSPVDKIIADQKLLQSSSMGELIGKLARIPLAYQPGTQWQYSLSVDVQGHLVEVLSGQSLGDFMHERIFAPLGMDDTAFFVPREKLPRLATLYALGPNGLHESPNEVPTSRPPMELGGRGLYATGHDYLRFAQALANGGKLDGARILAPGSVKLMSANHLPQALMRGGYGIGYHQSRPGFGYGYNVAVFDEPLRAQDPCGKGTFLWDGLAGNWFWIDPQNEIVFVGMIQRVMGATPDLEGLSRALVYQALLDR
jgi:CubicO group peptidase (beta-lactamase class C family)